MNRYLLIVITGVLAVSQSAAAGTAALEEPNALDTTKWREDLAVFREQMPKTHADLFHTMTREQFNASVDALEERLPQLTSNQVKVEVMRLVAMVNDGHTRIRQETLGNHMLPVRLHFFADGLYVAAADGQYANALGGKVMRIGKLSTEEAYVAVRSLVSVDKQNEYRRRLLSTELLVTPEVLQAIGATQNTGTIQFTVQKENKEIIVSLPTGPFRQWNNHGWPVNPVGWVDARDSVKKPASLWLRHPEKNYWHEFLTNERTLYIQYNQVHDEPDGEPISKYFPALLQEAKGTDVDRVILDLRLNGGGNNELNRPIWHALIKNQLLNQKGRLWVIIGPQTVSAAMNCVADLRGRPAVACQRI